MKKRIMAVLTSILMGTSICGAFPVQADNVITNFPYATGGLYSPVHETEIQSASYEQNAISDLPSSIDLSTDLAFPCIGDQGDIGSCTAWASTYYQFTHEVNKLKGTAAKELVNGQYTNIEENIYSPTWTYNYINGGGNNGTYVADAYRVLKFQGAMTLAEKPYDANNYNYDEWSSSIEELTSALEYRATYSYTYSLEEAKGKLANGHTLVAWTNAYGWAIESNYNGQKFIVRCGNVRDEDGNEGGHYVNIVGYNDNIQITVNGVTLTGAFKIANSWGSEWGNNGYIWVAYDALSSVSEFTGWETEYKALRVPMFKGTSFGSLDAYHCKPNFVGYVEYITTQKYDISLYADDSTSLGYTHDYQRWLNAIADSKTTSCYITPPKILIFDFFSPAETVDIGDHLSSNWTIRLVDDTTDDTGTICMRTRVIDNFGDIIACNTHNYTNLTNGIATITTPVNLAKGRVSAYDNSAITYADSEMVQKYVIESIDLSNVQRYLADYNSDGKVNLLDVSNMNRDIAARNGETYAITDYIDEWGCSLADVIEEEYNIPIEQYVAENYAELSAIDAVPAELELY